MRRFNHNWPTIGFLSLAVGGGMIVTAAVLPGHEVLILGVGSVGVLVAAGLVVYAYRSGHLEASSAGQGLQIRARVRM